VPAVRFFKTEAGNEPARNYLRSLEKAWRRGSASDLPPENWTV